MAGYKCEYYCYYFIIITIIIIITITSEVCQSDIKTHTCINSKTDNIYYKNHSFPSSVETLHKVV